MKKRISYRFTPESQKSFKICLINAGMTQADFAERADVSEGTVSAMLHGRTEVSDGVEALIRDIFPGFAKAFMFPEENSAKTEGSQDAATG